MDKILSVVIVNLNTKDLTVGCIRSIEKWAKDLSFEILLTDNGSNDGSVEAFEEIKREKYWKDKFTLTLNKENLGYAKANNQGIKKAKGKYILLLNNDTIVHKDSLQNILEFAEKTPDAGVVGPKLMNIDGSVQESCYHFPTILRAIEEFWLGKSGFFEKYYPGVETPVTVDSVVGAAFLITPEAKKRVGILDERYFAYFEDIDYCRNIWRNRLKVYYFPNSVITHYHGATFNKLANEGEKWKKLIPSSKIYHGAVRHYIINIIIWIGQKCKKVKTLLSK